MVIYRVLALPYRQFYDAHDGAQTHQLFAPMMCLSLAEGGKTRLGGQLPVGAFAPTADASIRVLPPTPLTRYLATIGLLICPNSYSFLWVKVHVFG